MNKLKQTMKNALVICSFLTIGTSFFNAQTNRYDWGIEGGPNLSTFRMSKNPYREAKPMIYGSAGFIFQFNMKKILSIRTGVYYQKKGYQQEIKETGTSGIVYSSTILSSEYHYLTLPVLARATFGKKIKFFVNAGPYISYLIAQKNVPEHGKPDVVEYNNKAYNGIKDWDFGVAEGIGIAVPVKSWLISLEVRNYSGILNTRIPNTAKTEQYTNTTDLNIGVAYRLGFREEK